LGPSAATLAVLDCFDGAGLAVPVDPPDRPPVTMALGALAADAEPAVLLAVTETRTVRPTSAGWTVYVAEVAPPMSVQL
jgi:hypothetical protein